MTARPLFSIMTGVCLLGGLLFFGQVSSGEIGLPSICDEPTEVVDFNTCKSNCGALTESKCKEACGKKCKDENEEAKDLINGVDKTGCDGAIKEWKEAKTKFETACGRAKMQGFNGEIGCLTEARLCQSGCDDSDFTDLSNNAQANDYHDKKCDLVNDSADDLEGVTFPTDWFKSTIPAPKTSTIDQARLDEVKKRFSECSPEAAAEYDDLKQEYTDARSQIREKQDEVNSLEDELNQLESDLQAKLVEFEEELLSIKQQSEDALNDLQDELTRVNGELGRQMAQLEDAIFSAKFEIAKADLEINKLEVQKADQIETLRQSCLASALTALNVRRQQRMEAIKNSRFAAGSSQNLYKLASISQKKREGYFVDRLARECESGEAFKRNVAGIERNIKAARDRFEVDKQRLQTIIKNAQAQIDKLNTEENRKVLEKHLENVKKLEERTDERFKMAAKKREAIIASMNKQIASKREQLRRGEAHLAEDKVEFDEAKAVFNYARRHSKGRRSDPDRYDEAMAYYNVFKGASDIFVTSCTEEYYCKTGDVKKLSRGNYESALKIYGDVPEKPDCTVSTPATTGGASPAQE